MGKLVVTEFVTLDGVFEDPGGAEGLAAGGWAFKFERGEEGNAFKVEELMAADAQLLGRQTYEGFAKAWPAMDGDDFGKKMNSMPKIVVSKTLVEPTWTNTTVLDGDLGAGVAALKQQYENILVAGSGTLVRGLLDLGLVDELRLMVYPTVLGSGRQLFEGVAQPQGFELASVERGGDCSLLVLANVGSGDAR
jgi:dihydrofolate reductase